MTAHLISNDLFDVDSAVHVNTIQQLEQRLADLQLSEQVSVATVHVRRVQVDMRTSTRRDMCLTDVQGNDSVDPSIEQHRQETEQRAWQQTQVDQFRRHMAHCLSLDDDNDDDNGNDDAHPTLDEIGRRIAQRITTERDEFNDRCRRLREENERLQSGKRHGHVSSEQRANVSATCRSSRIERDHRIAASVSCATDRRTESSSGNDRQGTRTSERRL
jgi:hypothetical protein